MTLFHGRRLSSRFDSRKFPALAELLEASVLLMRCRGRGPLWPAAALRKFSGARIMQRVFLYDFNELNWAISCVGFDSAPSVVLKHYDFASSAWRFSPNV